MQVKEEETVDGIKHGIHQGKSASFYISSSPDEVALVEGMKKWDSCREIPIFIPSFYELIVVCLSVCLRNRLGFTYLRLKDGQMEILNREDEIER